MDNELSEGPVPGPKKRLPRKTSTTSKRPEYKAPKKMMVEEIHSTFSAPKGDAIVCEYSDLVHSADAEEWALTRTESIATAKDMPLECNTKKSISVAEELNGEQVRNGKKDQNTTQGEDANCDYNFREHYRPIRSGDAHNGVERNERSNLNGDSNRNYCENQRNGSGERESFHSTNRNNNSYHENFQRSTFKNASGREPQRMDNNRNSNRSFQSHQNRKRSVATIRIGAFSIGYLRRIEYLSHCSQLENFCNQVVNFERSPLCLNEILNKSSGDLADFASSIDLDEASSRAKIIDNCMEVALTERRPIMVKGLLESMEGGDGIITYASDSYKIRPKSTFVPRCLIQSLGLRRGQTLTAFVHPPLEQATCPFAIKINNVLGKAPEEAVKFPRFRDLTPYYPTSRIFLEHQGALRSDSISMRVIDLLSPIGFGQRGLIVAPPKTGKTILLQGVANAIIHNQPETKLIVLLIDERPEEVTDFLRQVKGAEVISSTFDESAESHIHAAEIVIESARRWVEVGEHVVILLDSITRLARAYNTEQPSSGKILSGGVEANALQLPKRFFGSARNIEGGGSLTIIATALVETGSRMDDVIFEEFKGTGNMELHLDRLISDKRIFPAINFERSGTRKEELLYHPDELTKIYNLRRAFQGISSAEAMEMLIARLKQCPTNVEFLMNMNR